MASGQGGQPRESGPKPSASTDAADASTAGQAEPGKIKEIGGPKGPEPTRYGDWEKGGRCSDF
ncbi:MAG: DUF1674 domain-containing protein [Alphaproteobacteria bacterium]|nr:DUF1674 domain-containing protein [Alphaproteobacteria bacterium]